MPNQKPKVIILGKLPPPYYGPAIATEIILNSKLKEAFNLIHVDSRLNSSMNSMGKFRLRKVFLSIAIFTRFIRTLYISDTKLVLVPIAQKTSALMKDAVFILFARLYKKKVLLHLRGSNLLTWYQNSNAFARFFFRRLFSNCDGAIVLGEKLRYIFEPFLPDNKIFVVPNGADFTYPPRNSRKLYLLSVLYFSNLLPSKGIEDILDAISFLQDEVKNKMYLDVVGSWCSKEFEEYCNRKVKQNKLPVIFHYAKTGSDKLRFFANADIFVFPPRDPEGHPWVIIEAMAAGLPIITTNQGAITESVIDEVNGFLVEPCNPQKIAERIKILISNPALRGKMGSESRRIYEEKFTEDKMINNLTHVFNEILEQPN
jgi:glycosyltransferase involved in cell wall biosynthesis